MALAYSLLDVFADSPFQGVQVPVVSLWADRLPIPRWKARRGFLLFRLRQRHGTLAT